MAAEKETIEKEVLEELQTVEAEEAALYEKDDKGYTPFLLAVSNGDLPLLQSLLKKFPSLIQQRTTGGATALLIAAAHGHINIIEFLISNKFSSYVERTDSGYSALLMAVINDDENMVQFLLKQPEVSLLEADDEGYTALAYACYEKNPTMIQILLKYGAYIDSVTNQGDSILKLARDHHLEDSITELEFAQELIDSAGKSTVEINDDIFWIKISKDSTGMNVRRIKDGNTALHLALIQGKLDLSSKLILCHSDLMIPNHKGEKAVDIIKQSSNIYLKACVALVELEKPFYELEDCRCEIEERETKETLESLDARIKTLDECLLPKAEEAISLISKLENNEQSKALKLRLGMMLGYPYSSIFNPKLGYRFITEGDYQKSNYLEEASRCLLECIMADTSLPWGLEKSPSESEFVKIKSLDSDSDSESNGKEKIETKEQEHQGPQSFVNSKPLGESESLNKTESKEKLDHRLKLILQYALDAETETVPLGNFFHQYIFGGKESVIGFKGFLRKDTNSILALADKCKEEFSKKEAYVQFIERELKETKEREERLRSETSKKQTPCRRMSF